MMIFKTHSYFMNSIKSHQNWLKLWQFPKYEFSHMTEQVKTFGLYTGDLEYSSNRQN